MTTDRENHKSWFVVSTPIHCQVLQVVQASVWLKLCLNASNRWICLWDIYRIVTQMLVWKYWTMNCTYHLVLIESRCFIMTKIHSYEQAQKIRYNKRDLKYHFEHVLSTFFYIWLSLFWDMSGRANFNPGRRTDVREVNQPNAFMEVILGLLPTHFYLDSFSIWSVAFVQLEKIWMQRNIQGQINGLLMLKNQAWINAMR